MKNRIIAIFLAFFLGAFGIHKFYLGRTGAGVLYLLLSWTGISYLLGIIDTISLAFMGDREFDLRYNGYLTGAAHGILPRMEVTTYDADGRERRLSIGADPQLSLQQNRQRNANLPDMNDKKVQEVRAKRLAKYLGETQDELLVEEIARDLEWSEQAVVDGLSRLVEQERVMEDYDFDRGAFTYKLVRDEFGHDVFDRRSMSVTERAQIYQKQQRGR